MSNENFTLFCEYLRELDKIAERTQQDPAEDIAYFEDCISSDAIKWLKIRACNERKPVGFLLIGTEPNCHPDADFFIQEAYIKPEFRKQGLMTATVSKFVKNNEGIYCLFILNNNQNAHQFWHNLFEKLDYEPYTLDACSELDICTQYGFAPKKGKQK